jgi:hypothetical protein
MDKQVVIGFRGEGLTPVVSEVDIEVEPIGRRPVGGGEAVVIAPVPVSAVPTKVALPFG